MLWKTWSPNMGFFSPQCQRHFSHKSTSTEGVKTKKERKKRKDGWGVEAQQLVNLWYQQTDFHTHCTLASCVDVRPSVRFEPKPPSSSLQPSRSCSCHIVTQTSTSQRSLCEGGSYSISKQWCDIMKVESGVWARKYPIYSQRSARGQLTITPCRQIVLCRKLKHEGGPSFVQKFSFCWWLNSYINVVLLLYFQHITGSWALGLCSWQRCFEKMI